MTTSHLLEALVCHIAARRLYRIFIKELLSVVYITL